MDIYIAMEESYKNGYIKGREDTKKEMMVELREEMYRHDRYVDFELAEAQELAEAREELAFTRKFIHDHGLEFELAAEWEKAGHVLRRGRWIHKNGICFCSECMTCGVPHWRVCPVCEARMENSNGEDCN